MVNAFNAANEAVREFIASIDFDRARERLNDFTSDANERLTTLGESFGKVRRSVEVVAGGIQVALGLVGAAFNGVGTTIAGVLRIALLFREKMLGVLNTLTGGASETLVRLEEEVAAVGASVSESLDKFAAATRQSLSSIGDGFVLMAGQSERAADRIEQSSERAGEAIDRELVARQEAAREQTDRLKEALLEAGLSAEQLGIDVTEAGDKIEESADGAAESVDRMGRSLDELPPKVDRIIPLAAGLNIVGDAADDTSARFDSMGVAIAQATTQTQIDALIGQVEALAQTGALTEDQVDELRQALEAQSRELERNAQASGQASRSVQQLGQANQQAAQNIRQTGGALEEAEQKATRFSGTAGGVISRINQLKAQFPELGDEIDKIARDSLGRVGFSFGVFQRRGAAAINAINRLVERWQEQQERANRTASRSPGLIRDLGSSARDAARDVDRLNQSTAAVGGGEITQLLKVQIEVPTGDRLVLSEAQINRIAQRVMTLIENDQQRTGG